MKAKPSKPEMTIVAHVGAARKQAILRVAKRRNMTLSDLMRRMIDEALGDAAPRPPANTEPPSMVL